MTFITYNKRGINKTLLVLDSVLLGFFWARPFVFWTSPSLDWFRPSLFWLIPPYLLSQSFWVFLQSFSYLGSVLPIFFTASFLLLFVLCSDLMAKLKILFWNSRWRCVQETFTALQWTKNQNNLAAVTDQENTNKQTREKIRKMRSILKLLLFHS